MLIVQARTPNNKIAFHRIQNSNPNVLNTSNLNSFHEYFQTQSQQKKENLCDNRCKTESIQIELKRNHAHKMSNQSTTISLTNSTSRYYAFSKMNQKSNSSFKNIEKLHPTQVNPFQEEDQTVNQKLQSQLTQLMIRTKELMHYYEQRQNEQIITEKKLNQEILQLKQIIEKQKKLLAKR